MNTKCVIKQNRSEHTGTYLGNKSCAKASQLYRQAKEQKNEIRDGILKVLQQNGKPCPRPEQVVIELVNFSFGTENHPIENIYFYSKATPDVGKRLSVDKITNWVPQKCEEQIIRVFLKPSESDVDGDNNKCQDLRIAFNKWFEETFEKASKQRS